jgi:hypothetical protein
MVSLKAPSAPHPTADHRCGQRESEMASSGGLAARFQRASARINCSCLPVCRADDAVQKKDVAQLTLTPFLIDI